MTMGSALKEAAIILVIAVAILSIINLAQKVDVSFGYEVSYSSKIKQAQ